MTNDEYFYKLLKETKDKYNSLPSFKDEVKKIVQETKQEEKYNKNWKKAVWEIKKELEMSLEKNREPIDEDTLEIEKIICDEFGCPSELSLVEKLAGDKCCTHMNRQPQTFFNSKL